MPYLCVEKESFSKEEIKSIIHKTVRIIHQKICEHPKKVLLLPPDITRAHCGAGWITQEFYKIFSQSAQVYLIPTLGQHLPHTPSQNRWMFGEIPEERILVHNWKKTYKILGEIPAYFVKEVSNGAADFAIPVAINNMVMDGGWDVIINIGHVVPHEVLGFANHNKNYFIGLGGKPMIAASHISAACYGIEKNLGRKLTPLRKCYNKAEDEFLKNLPDIYFMVVMGYDASAKLDYKGIYVGNDLETYLLAAEASAKYNIHFVPPLRKVVAFMDGNEFQSTWVANKAIYRTRMAMADGGELVIIAPGLRRFGEQPEVDALIRKYGYSGRDRIMDLLNSSQKDSALRDLAHGTAHLIHGSSEGRFSITYSPGYLTKEELESVGYNYMDLSYALKCYNPEKMRQGFNTTHYGEEIFFIHTPSVGLWTTKEKLAD